MRNLTKVSMCFPLGKRRRPFLSPGQVCNFLTMETDKRDSALVAGGMKISISCFIDGSKPTAFIFFNAHLLVPIRIRESRWVQKIETGVSRPWELNSYIGATNKLLTQHSSSLLLDLNFPLKSMSLPSLSSWVWGVWLPGGACDSILSWVLHPGLHLLVQG